MFSWLIDNVRGYLCNSNNAVVEPDHNKVMYHFSESYVLIENSEIRYDKLDRNQLYDNYLDIISEDKSILSLQELADVKEKDPVYVALKYTLVGAFFASSTAYPGSQYYYNQIHKFFIELTPDNFIRSGVNFFMYLKRCYGPNSSKLLIFNMMKNHQDMMSKVEQIVFQLTTIITKNAVFITKDQIENIIRVNLANYTNSYGKKESEEIINIQTNGFIEQYFSKSFIDTKSHPIEQEMLSKLNNAHLIAKCLMLQFLLDCWKIEDLTPENYTATLVKSINTLLNSLGLDSSFTAETLKITDVDILKTEKQEEKEDEADNIAPNSREIILKPEYGEVKIPETTDLSLKLVDKERTINSTISSKPVEPDKNSEKPVELSQLSGFLGPDNDPDGCAINISGKTTEAKPEDSYMFEWIKIIEAKEVQEYLLSLASIQNLQNATVKMQDQALHVQRTDWSIDFASRDPSDNDNYYRLEQQAKVSLHSCELQQTVLDYM